jgi:phosphatidylserine/phosphatidylglycerophosphate/cardiolipin synthase-like enzyme
MWKSPRLAAIVLAILAVPVCVAPAGAQVVAQESLCDSSIDDCRKIVLDLIRAETVGIDVGFWFMEDSRFSNELIARWQAGVPVRVVVDPKANASYPLNVDHLNALKNAGIPMRQPVSRYFHWKTMIFAGQNVVQTGSPNYSPSAFVPISPLVNFQDESILFSNDPVVVNSYKRMFDVVWTSSYFKNYANVTSTPTQSYPVYTIDPNLNFPPLQDFGARSVPRYNAETAATGGIDVIMYRITDSRHTDAILAAHQRLVPVRVIVEQAEYRVTKRYQHSYNVDRLIAAGIPVRQRKHAGGNHQKLTLLRGQQMAIFGSQNWSQTSGQYEHNYFTKKAALYQWMSDIFLRKWNSSSETEPFVILPPDQPVYVAPSSGANVNSDTVTLRWHAGFWAYKYDIYFGTSPNPPLLAADVNLGNSITATDYVDYTITGLAPDTTYYWRIVSKTMADMTASGSAAWNFRTGAPPAPGAGDVVLWTAKAPTIKGVWTLTADTTAAAGWRLGSSDVGFKVSSPLANPTDYFEMSFNASAGVPYRLWLRGKAVSNSWANDSAFVQFSDSVTSGGTPTWQIGTTSATAVTIEDCTSCGLSAWGWNDNLTTSVAGALGTPVYFATTGTHTVRVQLREDGLSLDQIVLSQSTFLNAAPGTTKNDGTILPEQGGSGGAPPPPPPPPLPSGWQAEDIGAVGVAGSASHNSGTFTVEGGGADVFGTADAFHYAYRTLSGDGTITARVASLTGTQAWTKIGVMIRGSTAANAAHGFMVVSKDKGLAFQYRPSTGATSVSIAGAPAPTTAPRWVRLTRAANVITAFESANGVNWTTVGSATISLPASVLIGLVSHSHTTTALATGVFDNVSVP